MKHASSSAAPAEDGGAMPRRQAIAAEVAISRHHASAAQDDAMHRMAGNRAIYFIDILAHDIRPADIHAGDIVSCCTDKRY